MASWSDGNAALARQAEAQTFCKPWLTQRSLHMMRISELSESTLQWCAMISPVIIGLWT
jgi:hypothetical protein